MLGDLVAQAPDMSKGKQWDARRTAKMGAFGVALHGPIGHYWYGFLDRTIMTAAPTSAAAVATKTIIDQTVLAPIFTAMFFGSMKAMDGKADEVQSEIKDKLWPTMKVNWTVYVFFIIHLVPTYANTTIYDAVQMSPFIRTMKLADSSHYQLPFCPVITAHLVHQHHSDWIQCLFVHHASLCTERRRSEERLSYGATRIALPFCTICIVPEINSYSIFCRQLHRPSRICLPSSSSHSN